MFNFPCFIKSRRLPFAPLLLVVATILMLLPFLAKPFHIDDPMYLWVAEQIVKAPANFYGFDVNWHGLVLPMPEVMQNPPGVSYVIALITSLAGWSEKAVHSGFLVVACMSIVATYRLAQKLCRHPGAAALAFLFSPAFVVSASNAMSDVLLTGLFTYAVYLWIKAIEDDRFHLLAIAVIVASLAALTKYYGIVVVPLLLAYSAAKRKLGPSPVFLLFPLAVMAVYQGWIDKLYGIGGLTEAAAYAREIKVGGGFVAKIGTSLAFTGGCFIASLFTAPLAWGWKKTFVGTACAAFPALFFLFCLEKPLPALFPSGFVVQYVLFFSAGCGMIIIAFADYRRERSPESLLLLLWLTGTIIFAGFINWTVSVRNILPAMPAAAILLIRHLEHRGQFEKITVPRLLLPLASLFVVTVAVAWADYRLAYSAKVAAETISRRLAPVVTEGLLFEGHWGFQYYMQRLGGQPVDFDKPESNGRLVVVPLNNSNVRLDQYSDAEEIARFEFPVAGWVTTMSKQTGAGFYSDRWGPLPFVIGPVPPETYRVFRVKIEHVSRSPVGHMARTGGGK